MASVIGADLRVVGDLSCRGDVQVSGWVQGDIVGRTVTIEQHATVHGNLSGEAVHIRGIVNGDVRADTVVLAGSAHLVGDIIHLSLAIEEGAYLDGACRRIDRNPASIISVNPNDLSRRVNR